jgi:hypothetical protein
MTVESPWAQELRIMLGLTSLGAPIDRSFAEVTHAQSILWPVIPFGRSRAGGTRITIEHRGWEAIDPEHRVRHGLEPSAFAAMMGRWWGDLATTFRMRADAPWSLRSTRKVLD